MGQGAAVLSPRTLEREEELRQVAHNELMEQSNRRRRAARARKMADEEQQRRVEEYEEREMQELSHEEREQLQDAIRQEQEERSLAFQRGEDAPARAFARRSSLDLMLEAQGDTFQRKWQRQNGFEDEQSDEDEDAYAERLYSEEQDHLSREARYELALAESERRDNQLAARQMVEEERSRRLSEVGDTGRPSSSSFAQVQQQAARAARRRSFVRQVLPSQEEDRPEPGMFEDYKAWAEGVMVSLQEVVDFQASKIEALSQAYDSSMAYIESCNARLEYAQEQFEWDQERIDSYDNQLKLKEEELQASQSQVAQLEDMLEGSMLTLQEQQEQHMQERAARLTAEDMLEKALLELAQARQDLAYAR